MPGTVRHVRPAPQRVIVVTGLAFEARIAAGAGVQVVCSQNHDLVAKVTAAIAQTSECSGLVSFGTAAGLIDRLRPGAWVVASEIVDQDGCMPCHTGWSRLLAQRLSQIVESRNSRAAVNSQIELTRMVGVAKPVVSQAAKRALQARYGAVAADMESHWVARTAAAHGLPFACCRVVIDPVERDLPPAALAGMRADGTTDLGAVLRSLARRPGQLGGLLRLGADAQRAQRALRAGRATIGPAFDWHD